MAAGCHPHQGLMPGSLLQYGMLADDRFGAIASVWSSADDFLINGHCQTDQVGPGRAISGSRALFDHSTTSEIIWVGRSRIGVQSRQRHLKILRMQESAGSKMLPQVW
jgi:hypothetical protein